MTISIYEVCFKELENFVITLDIDDTKKAMYFKREWRDSFRKMINAYRF